MYRWFLSSPVSCALSKESIRKALRNIGNKPLGLPKVLYLDCYEGQEGLSGEDVADNHDDGEGELEPKALHAKLMAVRGKDNRTLILAGSSNCTKPGLHEGNWEANVLGYLGKSIRSPQDLFERIAFYKERKAKKKPQKILMYPFFAVYDPWAPEKSFKPLEPPWFEELQFQHRGIIHQLKSETKYGLHMEGQDVVRMTLEPIPVIAADITASFSLPGCGAFSKEMVLKLDSLSSLTQFVGITLRDREARSFVDFTVIAELDEKQRQLRNDRLFEDFFNNHNQFLLYASCYLDGIPGLGGAAEGCRRAGRDKSGSGTSSLLDIFGIEMIMRSVTADPNSFATFAHLAEINERMSEDRRDDLFMDFWATFRPAFESSRLKDYANA